MKERILVIEDQRDIADSLVRLLAAMGYESRAIYEGHLAEAAAIDFLPDMAFIDIGMPSFDGYQTVSKIKGHRQCAHVILVALTGYADAESKQRAFEAGFDRFVAKPMNIETLKELLTLVDPNVEKKSDAGWEYRLSEIWKQSKSA